MPDRALDLGAALDDHIKVPLVLLYIIIKYAMTSLALQLDLFLDVQELLVDGVNFNAPL